MRKVARARTADEKADRSAALVAAARELLSGKEYAAVSVAAIARRAGVAKGTVFLYFPTKEALGLAVLGELLGDWAADLRERLDGLERPASPSTVAAAARRSLDDRGGLLRLLGLVSGLEANGGSEAVSEFRREMRRGAAALATQLESSLPFMRRGEGLEVALTLHALMIGIHQMAPGRLEGALDGQEMAPFRVDVPGAVGRTLRVQLEGAKAVASVAPASAP